MDRPKIEVRRLRYVAGDTEILTGVDALVPDGEVTAVVGPSGAGKSTLLRAINRLIEPSSGEVYLDGEPTGSLDHVPRDGEPLQAYAPAVQLFPAGGRRRRSRHA